MSEEPTALPPPRWVVILVTLTVTAGMLYTATRGDYKTTIVLAVVVLFLLGADMLAWLRAWRGQA